MSIILTEPITKNTKKERKQLDQYVGIIVEITDPLNLFLRIDDLNDRRRRYIYYYIYSIGKTKVVIWGVYDRRMGRFYVDSKCKYKSTQLITMIKQWKSNGYDYILNSVKDRFSTKLNKMIGLSVPEIKSRKHYRTLKIITEYIDPFSKLDKNILLHELSQDDIDGIYSDIEYTYGPDYSQDDMLDFIDKLRDDIKKYESKINRTDIDIKFKNINEIIDISNKFYTLVKKGKFSYESDISDIEQCPDFNNCEPHNCWVYYYGDLTYPYNNDTLL